MQRLNERRWAKKLLSHANNLNTVAPPRVSHATANSHCWRKSAKEYIWGRKTKTSLPKNVLFLFSSISFFSPKGNTKPPVARGSVYSFANIYPWLLVRYRGATSSNALGLLRANHSGQVYRAIFVPFLFIKEKAFESTNLETFFQGSSKSVGDLLCFPFISV